MLHHSLQEQSSEIPDKPALLFKDRTLTYRELDRLSSRLSSHCVGNGAVSGERVGIYMDKSLDSIVAIFGILKSGACYVPLDPLAPVERQNLIVNDCALKYLVTSYRKLPRVQSIALQSKDLQYIYVMDRTRDENDLFIPGVTMYFRDDIETSLIDGHSARERQSPESLAYILYTSGSTGQPKGVMLSHRAALAFVEWSQRTFEIVGSDIVSSHAPLHFDLSIFDIFVSIRAGATICLVPQGLSTYPKSLVDLIETSRITTWYSVPSILTQMAMYGKLEERKLPDLRQVLFAGEVFPSKYLANLMKQLSGVRFYNLYGPTETNVITYYHVKVPPEDGKTIPIGLLCDNVRSYVLNDAKSIVPTGKTGELYVETPTLMDGYWNDQHKTDNVMKNSPFSPSPVSMLYRTGDIVHWNGDGFLEYHGRRDTMIKSRGYRIELGDIEAALSAHPGIKETAVTAVPSDTIGNSIKAVIVPGPGEKLSADDIELFCSKKLPGYMVPEIVTFVEALPRTSTGKIDRIQL